MIRTRQDFEDDLAIAGNGEYVIARTLEERQLMSALVCMTKLGQRPYQKAAYNLLEAIEDLTDDSDFAVNALDDIAPVLEVIDPADGSTAMTYDGEDFIFQFDV